ncbi:hypothetical protein VT569_04795 [Flavobacterium psychrophilum]|uniref:hypothetical protein n=1 Tax=Flavobacterium psychrophilum TaxID=96345 RepID=UPI00114FE6B7|nr:hypothetical protein [Flavobacterium psychrophilum]GEJ31002.1 hypothetical protein FPN184_contig00008-0001 [Flavobacterium psychrophilum]GEJ49837.1 hypothetical protein FPKKA176_contig00039-0001 [Flavobacterium psychrophilum]
MKLNFRILFFLTIFIISCKKNEIQNEELKIITTFNPKDKNIEENLNLQLGNYLKAMYGGDADTVIKYCYPDMFIWLKKEYPAEYSMDMIKKSFLEPVKELKRLNAENQIKFEFEIKDITKRIINKNERLYLIVVSGNQSKKFNEYKIGDEIVAISLDNGTNWTFMIKDPEMTPEILGINFSKEIISKLMD